MVLTESAEFLIKLSVLPDRGESMRASSFASRYVGVPMLEMMGRSGMLSLCILGSP